MLDPVADPCSHYIAAYTRCGSNWRGENLVKFFMIGVRLIIEGNIVTFGGDGRGNCINRFNHFRELIMRLMDVNERASCVMV